MKGLPSIARVLRLLVPARTGGPARERNEAFVGVVVGDRLDRRPRRPDR